MDAHKYNPKPLEVSTGLLTDEVLKIAELLAENAHRTWVRERTEQGWKFGQHRDDAKKEHPYLIPYEGLPEPEKQLNRNAAWQTVQELLLLSKGQNNLQIQALLTPEGDSLAQGKELIARLKRTNLTAAELRKIWLERVPTVWMRNVDIYRRMVDACLRLGEAFLGFDIAAEGLQSFKEDLRLVQLQALALARTGATKRANQILQELRSHGHQDEETLGLLARTHKDFWLIATDPLEKSEHLELSYQLYLDAYERNRGYYSGINAASMALIAGKTDKAHEIARDVTALCQEATRKTSDATENYWLQSTLAEASLVLGEIKLAEVMYKTACKLGGQTWAVVSRTRAQARLLLEASGLNTNFLDHCFPAPRVVVASGHMFDRANRKNPRFPRALEERIRKEISSRLEGLGAQVGFCSLACGTDMIFSEAILQRGGEINIVLPFPKDDFKVSSVNFLGDPEMDADFEGILENAATVTTLNESGTPEQGAVYEYCNQTLVGLALLKAQFLGVEVIPLAIWDGKEGDGRGGTRDFIAHWELHKIPVEIIRIDKIMAEEMNIPVEETVPQPAKPPPPPARPTAPSEVSPLEIKAMLFADIVGYTKLTESQIPAFASHFLGRVATLIDGLREPPVATNTWGDAMYCAFETVAGAGSFALKLNALVTETNWKEYDLPGELTIRIALHAGPTYPCFDPILRRLTFLGSHVNRTARIEPIAEEGQIYASQAFAALVAAQGVKGLVCDYVGIKQLAKSYGAFPVFLVRRAKGSEGTIFYRKRR